MNEPDGSDTLCPLPWLHVSVNTDESLRVCCNADAAGAILADDAQKMYLTDLADVSQAVNSRHLTGVRREMMAGRRPASCAACYRLEDSGVESLRNVFSQRYKDVFPAYLRGTRPDGSIEPKVFYLDFALSNNCNLKCRMCVPQHSASIADDWRALGYGFDRAVHERARDGWKVDERFRGLMGQMLEHCEEILLTGGEPFIAAQHYEILQMAVDRGAAGRITLRYHTNLTTLPQKLVDAWRAFKAIEVHASIDGFDKVNEYIRYPTRWRQSEAGLKRLVELKASLPIEVEVHTCLQAYNIFDIPALMDYLAGHGEDFQTVPYFIWLNQPSQLSVQVLPQDLKTMAAERIAACVGKRRAALRGRRYERENLVQLANLEGMLELMMAPAAPELQREFVSMTKAFDRARGQNIGAVVPELAGLFA